MSNYREEWIEAVLRVTRGGWELKSFVEWEKDKGNPFLREVQKEIENIRKTKRLAVE